MNFSSGGAAALLLLAGSAVAQAPQASDCVALLSDAARLACYDLLHGREATAAREVVAALPADVTPKDKFNELIRRERLGSTLDERWELGETQSLGRFLPRAYKPIYVLPLTYTDRINKAPSSPSPDHQGAVPADLSAVEAKFQLSLKAKIWEGVIAEQGNLWMAYTQSSRWQVFNGGLSRPFRETNYEPELILAFSTPFELLGWHGRMASLSLNHQSNGRALPLSRSWNRIIGELALERGDWSLSLRPWWRIREKLAADDNPGIEDHVGRAELLLTHQLARHVFTLQARHSLRGGAQSRGSVQLDWAFPLATGLHGYLQVFSGYGESLIDYNFRQTKLGLGVSVVEWR